MGQIISGYVLLQAVWVQQIGKMAAGSSKRSCTEVGALLSKWKGVVECRGGKRCCCGKDARVSATAGCGCCDLTLQQYQHFRLEHS